ncbi:MAG: hypothetical protein PUC73_10535 [Lachnospiraceae bacterium]|nr:hypothetical protein [Lachnospiraceae bacterium]
MEPKDIRTIEEQDFDIIENAVVALRELWKKKLLIILVTIAGFLMSVIFISIKGNSTNYYSSATLFSAVYGSYSDTTTGVAAMNRYADLIKSSRVCSRAAQDLAAYNITSAELRKMTIDGDIRVSGASTNSASYGYKLTVSVYSESKETIVAVANAMASAFAAELNDLLGTQTIQVMDEASGYGSYNTLNVTMYLLLFTGAAFVLACGLIFVFAFFSPWVRSVAQCEQDYDLILGMLPYTKNK